MTTLDKITLILKKLPHKTQVSFALYCAKDVFPLIKDKDLSLKAKVCIDLTQRWLNDEAITNKELINAATSAASYAADAASYAAANATSAADAAAADAADAAAYIAYAASYAAAYASNAAYAASAVCAAASAVCAAAYAANTATYKEKKLLEYLNWFKLSKLEYLIYDLNE